jgi:hypothetical protein
MSRAEEIFLTGKAPHPVERSLLTTGLVAAGLQSLADNQKRLPTPPLSGGFCVHSAEVAS